MVEFGTSFLEISNFFQYDEGREILRDERVSWHLIWIFMAWMVCFRWFL